MYSEEIRTCELPAASCFLANWKMQTIVLSIDLLGYSEKS